MPLAHPIASVDFAFACSKHARFGKHFFSEVENGKTVA